MVFENIEDKLGYLILNQDGAVIASDGDLKNSESTANIITNVVNLIDSIPPHSHGYNKLTITYPDCDYIVSLSNKKIYVLKREFHAPENVLSETTTSITSEISDDGGDDDVETIPVPSVENQSITSQ